MWKRPGAILLMLIGAALVLRPVAIWAQSADQAEPTFTGFNISADSSGIAATFGDPKSPPYPTAAGIVPQTLATLGTGSTGYALASVAWPGPLAANAGSLAGLVLPVCVPNGNGVCTPKAPPQATLANYPIRAEASSPTGPNEATFAPGMTATARGQLSEARAELQNASSPGAFSLGTVVARSRSAIDNGVAVGTSETRVTGIDFGGGAITVDSVTTLARATNDAKNPTSTGSAVVQGLKIQGRPASVDDTGVHVAGNDSANPAGAVVDQLNQQALKQMSMEIFMTRPVKTHEGDTVTYRSGALVIDWKLADSGQEIVLSIGGSSVQAQATGAITPPGATELPLPGAVGSGGLGGGQPAGAGTGAVSPSGGALGVPGALLRPAPSTGLSTQTRPLTSARQFETDVPAGWVVLAFLGAVLFAVGLRRLSTSVLEAAPATCPIEGRPQ